MCLFFILFIFLSINLKADSSVLSNLYKFNFVMGDNFNHIPATDTCVRQVSKSPIEVAVMLKYAVINKYILNDGINFPHSLSVIFHFCQPVYNNHYKICSGIEIYCI